MKVSEEEVVRLFEIVDHPTTSEGSVIDNQELVWETEILDYQDKKTTRKKYKNEPIDSFENFIKWSEFQNKQILPIFNYLPYFDPKDANVINEWISAFNEFFDLYSGIKSALLRSDTYDFQVKNIIHISARGPWLKECVTTLGRRVVKYLESSKMIENHIDKSGNDMSVVDIWNYLLNADVNYTKVLAVRLSEIAEYMFVYKANIPRIVTSDPIQEYIRRNNSKFIERSYDPAIKFLVKIDHLILGTTYYNAVKENTGDLFCKTVSQYYKDWLVDQSKDPPLVEDVIKTFNELPKFEHKPISETEANNLIYAMVVNEESERNLRYQKFRKEGFLDNPVNEILVFIGILLTIVLFIVGLVYLVSPRKKSRG